MEVKRYIPPIGHPLHPYVDSIWRCHIPKAPRKEMILPKGLVDIVFYLSTPAQIFSAKRLTTPLSNYPVILGGLHTGTILVKPDKEFYNMGVSLKAETCAAILNLPLSELTDLTVEPGFIFKDINNLWEKLCIITDFNKQCILIEQWLLQKLNPFGKQKLILHSCDYLKRETTEANLEKLSKSLGVSSRHLRRLFFQYVGISPSKYLRLNRFIKAIYAISNNSKSLTQIAHNTYYTDQAHFCRDFKEFAGMTPVEYKKVVSKVPGHIFL